MNIATALYPVRSGSVIRIHYRLTMLVSLNCSDIFDACVCYPEPPILSSFLASFDLFQSAWLVLASMATPDGGDSDLPNDINNCIAICYEKDVQAGVPSFGKKSTEPRFQVK